MRINQVAHNFKIFLIIWKMIISHGCLKPLNRQQVVARWSESGLTAGHGELLGSVTHKLSFQVSDSIKSVQDYGATEHSAPWQHQP